MGVKVREKVKQSGVWWVFISHNGRRTSRKVGSEKAALEVARKIEAKLILGKPAFQDKPPVPTLQRYYETYEKPSLSGSVRGTTGRIYRTAFELHILPVLGSKRLDEITRLDVERLVTHLLNKRHGKKKRKFTRTTIGIAMRCLTASFNRAIERGFIEKSPTKGASKLFAQAAVRNGEIQPLNADEVRLFLRTVLKHSPDYYPLFLCAIHTGLRLGEIAALQWGDLDFNGKFVLVRRNFVEGEIIPFTKTKETRRVDLSDTLLRALQSLKRIRMEEWLSQGRNEIPEWVFCNGKGNPPNMSNLKNRHFYKNLERAGLRHIRFHDLRHTFASLLIQDGQPLAYVKDQLGHSSIKLTVDVYGHLEPGANREAVNRLPVLDEPATADGQENIAGK